MVLAGASAQLAGQIPVIAMAGVTLKYKEAMLDGRGMGRKRNKKRVKGKRNSLGGTSPI